MALCKRCKERYPNHSAASGVGNSVHSWFNEIEVKDSERFLIRNHCESCYICDDVLVIVARSRMKLEPAPVVININERKKAYQEAKAKVIQRRSPFRDWLIVAAKRLGWRI